MNEISLEHRDKEGVKSKLRIDRSFTNALIAFREKKKQVAAKNIVTYDTISLEIYENNFKQFFCSF